MTIIKRNTGTFYQKTITNRRGRTCHVFTDKQDKACDFPSEGEAEDFIIHVLDNAIFGGSENFTLRRSHDAKA